MSAALAQAAKDGRDEPTREEMEQFAEEQARAYSNMDLAEFPRRAADDPFRLTIRQSFMSPSGGCRTSRLPIVSLPDRFLGKERFLAFSTTTIDGLSDCHVDVGPRDEEFAALTVPCVVTLRTVGGIPAYSRSTLEIDYGDHPDFQGERKVNTFTCNTVGRADSRKPQLAPGSGRPWNRCTRTFTSVEGPRLSRPRQASHPDGK